MTSSRPVMSLPIADIAIGPRIGFYHPVHAARIGESMAAEGQHDPIHVKRNGNAAKPRWTLVAGLHRLSGAKCNGWSEIDAIQVANASATDADLRRLELSENVDHLHRRPIERAIIMAEYARLEEQIDHPANVGETQQMRAARIRHSAAANVAAANDWRSRTANAFDVSLRQLERHQRLYRQICTDEKLSDLAQRLNEHPFGESLNVMEKLAGVKDAADRRKVAELILEPERDWKSISEVFVAAGISASAGSRVDQKHPDAGFWDRFRAMSPPRRRVTVRQMSKILTPSEVEELIEGLKERRLVRDSITLA